MILIDLDDTLARTTELMAGDVSKVGDLKLISGADVFVERFGKACVLVTVGIAELQWKKLEVLGIAHSFKEIHILDSFQAKRDAFSSLIKGTSPRNHWVIGDRLDAEIRAGKSLDIPTIRMRIKGGKYFHTVPHYSIDTPTHTFGSFEEVIQFLDAEAEGNK